MPHHAHRVVSRSGSCSPCTLCLFAHRRHPSNPRRKSGLKGSVIVKQGDVITVRGKGRVVVGEVSKTAKERFVVELQRYL